MAPPWHGEVAVSLMMTRRLYLFKIALSALLVVLTLASTASHAHTLCADHHAASNHHPSKEIATDKMHSPTPHEPTSHEKCSIDHCCGLHCLVDVARQSFSFDEPFAKSASYNPASLLRMSLGVQDENLDPPKA